MQILQNNKIYIRVESLISWLEWSMLVLALVAYIYFIAMSVIQVVLRQELLVAIEEAETRVSTLEATYIVGSSKLSRDTAEEYGLVALGDASYVTVLSENDRLTRRE